MPFSSYSIFNCRVIYFRPWLCRNFGTNSSIFSVRVDTAKNKSKKMRDSKFLKLKNKNFCSSNELHLKKKHGKSKISNFREKKMKINP